MSDYLKSIIMILITCIAEMCIFAVYITKGHRTVGYKKRFLSLIILSLVMIALGFIYPYTIQISHKYSVLNEIICRAYILSTLVFTIELFVIIFSSTKKDSILLNSKTVYSLLFIIIFLIIVGISSFGSVDYILEEGKPYSISGGAMNISNFLLLTVGFIELILIIIKRVRDKETNIIPFVLTYIECCFLVIYEYVTKINNNDICIFYLGFLISIYMTLDSQDFALLKDIKNKISDDDIRQKVNNNVLGYSYHELRSELSIMTNYNDLISKAENINDSICIEAMEALKISSERIDNNLKEINSIIKLENGTVKTNPQNYSLAELEQKLKTIYNFEIVYDKNLPKIIYGDDKLLLTCINYITRSIKKINPSENIHIRISGIQERYKYNMQIIINTVNKPITKELFLQNTSILSLATSNKNMFDLNIICANEIAKLLGGNIDFDDINGSKFTINITQSIVEDEKESDR